MAIRNPALVVLYIKPDYNVVFKNDAPVVFYVTPGYNTILLN